MKQILPFVAMLAFGTAAGAQSLSVTQTSASAVAGGINVNVKSISYNGAGYVSHAHTVNGTTIDLTVCYYFNMTLPVLTFDDDFFIPVTEAGNYTVNITVYNSSSAEICDYFSVAGGGMHQVLDTVDFVAEKSRNRFYPNPTHGPIAFADGGQPADIAVYDQLGRIVMRHFGTQIDLSTLNSGIYIVTARTDTGIFTQKLIKN